MTKTFQTKPLRKSQVELHNIKVDLIIPFHGQYQKVHQLLKSIWIGTKSNPYQIYLVDDCSPNKTFISSFEKAPYTKIIQSTEQLGFGGALSAGFEESSNLTELEKLKPPTEFVVFMHSDCHIEDPNWLLELLRTYMILQKDKVGLVVARTNNPGEEIDPRLRTITREPIQDIAINEGYLPLYCALCEKGLFKKINGFIKSYPFGWYEDQELAYRMRRCGLKQGISGRSWIHHEGGLTFNTLLKKNPKISETLDGNRDRCLNDLRG